MKGSLSFTTTEQLNRSFLFFIGTITIIYTFIPSLNPFDSPASKLINGSLGTLCFFISISARFIVKLSKHLKTLSYIIYTILLMWFLISHSNDSQAFGIPIIIWVMLSFSGSLFHSLRSFLLFTVFALGGITAFLLYNHIPLFESYYFGFSCGLLCINGLLIYQKDIHRLNTDFNQVHNQLSPMPSMELSLFGDVINYNKEAANIFSRLEKKGNVNPFFQEFRDQVTNRGIGVFNSEFSFEWAEGRRTYMVTCQYYKARDSFFLYFQDITRENELIGINREQEEMFQIIFQGTNEGLIMVDTTGKISFVNQQFCKLFGYTTKELLGREAAGLLVDNSDPAIIRKRLADRINGKSQVYQAHQTTKNGDKLWTLISASPYRDRNGNVRGTVAAITDLSPLKKAQAELEERNEQMDMFLYKASHDLKGPLASVKGILNLAIQYCKEEEVKNYIEMAIMSAERLDNAVVDLLRVTRINNLQLQVEEVDVPSMVYEVIRSIDHLEERQDVQITTEFHIDKPFHTDRGSLHSILQNLVINAVKYKNPNQSSPKVDIDISNHKNGIRLIISDNGEGIREDVQRKVFNMFYRGNKKSKGTGLGLYIVKQSVEKMKGTIHFESAVSKGTTFTIYLPELKAPHTLESQEIVQELSA